MPIRVSYWVLSVAGALTGRQRVFFTAKCKSRGFNRSDWVRAYCEWRGARSCSGALLTGILGILGEFFRRAGVSGVYSIRGRVFSRIETRRSKMNRRFSIRFPSMFLAAGFIVVLGDASARAGFVTWEFAGEATSVQDDTNLLGGAVTVGSPFSGTFTFDPDATDSDPHPRRGFYEESIIDFSGAIATVPFWGPVGNRNSIEVKNGFGSPTLDSFSVRPDVRIVGVDLDVTIGLFDSSGIVFGSDALPVLPPDLDFFSTRRFILFDQSETLSFRVAGDVSSLAVIPEPSTFALLGLGSVLVARRFRSSRRRMRHSAGSRSLAFFLLSVFVPWWLLLFQLLPSRLAEDG